MVQFPSKFFFLLDFFNLCWVFQKFPFFCVILYIFTDILKNYDTRILRVGSNTSSYTTLIIEI